MASRRFTVDSAKKKTFVDIFLLLPETRVTDSMRSAKFTKWDIANLTMWHFLQRALPGGSIQGLKADVAGLLSPQPCHNRRPTRSVDDAIVNNVEADIIHIGEDSNTPVAVNSIVNIEPRTAVSSAAKAVASKRKLCNMWYYKNKKA